MPQTILNQCCVRSYIKFNDEFVNQGSGVIVVHDDKYFVITAEHCINGENGEYEGLPVNSIIFEYQDDYTKPFKSIKALSIYELNKEYDWALVEIEKPEIECDFLQVRFGTKFLHEEKVWFRGYQAINNTAPRTFPANIIDLAENEFLITIDGKEFEQGGELGATLAKGLSGSGVYIIRAKTLFLIGHLKRVIGRMALNSDIKCCKLTEMSSKLCKRDWTDMGSLDELEIWETAKQKEISEQDVQDWIDSNDIYFGRLLTKSQTLYPDEKAELVARERIISFLDQEYRNDQIRSSSDLIIKYEATAEAFEQSVKFGYTRTVGSRAEAKDLLLRLQTEFANHIKDLVKDESNKINMQLAVHKVTWWLMNCSFDFKE